jgi:hypothetical protein
MGRIARKGNTASATVRRAASSKRNEDLLPVIEDIRAAGYSTPQQIAYGLNERGITAARGGAWSAVQVRRILKPSIGQKATAQRVAQDSQKMIAAYPAKTFQTGLRSSPPGTPRLPHNVRRGCDVKPTKKS